MKKIAIAGFLLLAGCKTTEIVVDPVKPWEGHYMSVQQFKDSTERIELSKGESVWVLSNSTLKRVLKNAIEHSEK